MKGLMDWMMEVQYRMYSGFPSRLDFLTTLFHSRIERHQSQQRSKNACTLETFL